MADRKDKRAGFELLNIREPDKAGPKGAEKAGLKNAAAPAPEKPANPTPQKPKMPLRRKLFWAAVAMGGLYLLKNCGGGDPYLMTTPNRDLPPPDVFKKSDVPAATVTPPVARSATGRTSGPATDPHHIRQQLKPKEPIGSDVQETRVTPAERVDAAQAMLQAFYSSQGGTSPRNQSYAADVIAQKLNDVDARQPIYEILRTAQTHERTHIAMAGANKGTESYAFICTQVKNHITAFAHAAAKPDGQGHYQIVISPEVPHSQRPGGDYTTGMNLMHAYGRLHSCDTAMRDLNNDMNGTAELAALKVRVEHSTPYKFNWHR